MVPLVAIGVPRFLRCVRTYVLHVYVRGPSPQDVALRGVMQALVRIQAYMLADIVVAIPAVDLYRGSGVRAVARECRLVGVCCCSLSQLAAVYPPKTHVVLSAHVCPFPIRKL